MSDLIENWRFDPFLGTLNPLSLTETHTIELFQNFGNRYGIQLTNGILNELPSSVVIAGYTEVGKATAPASNQFRVDYDPLRQDGTVITAVRYYNTGFIEFNASQNGVSVTVNYKGTGRIVNGQNFAFFLKDTSIPGFLTVEGPFTTKGSWTSEGNARYSFPATQTFSAAGNETLNCATKSLFLKTGGTATITLSNMTEGQTIRIIVSSTGSAYALTWAGETFRWAFATVPTPTVTASRFDMYSFQKLGGVVYAFRTAVMG
jgi:hypothetical protein